MSDDPRILSDDELWLHCKTVDTATHRLFDHIDALRDENNALRKAGDDLAAFVSFGSLGVPGQVHIDNWHEAKGET